MKMKALSLAAGIVLALSGVAMAQGYDNGGYAPEGIHGGIHGYNYYNNVTPPSSTSSGAFMGAASVYSTNNDNGTMSGNPSSSGSGTPNNAGAVR